MRGDRDIGIGAFGEMLPEVLALDNFLADEEWGIAPDMKDDDGESGLDV